MIGHSVLHFARVFVGLDLPQTQTTRAERELLTSVLPGARRVVEIGVFEGFTTRKLAERAEADTFIIAPHDTLLTPDKPEGDTLRRTEHLHDHMRHDPRFDIVRQHASLSVPRER